MRQGNHEGGVRLPASVRIEVIEHSQQRYDTPGDWTFEADTLVVRVSRMSKPIYGWLVAVHELVEALLCCIAGVTAEEVDDFDQLCGREPGDNPFAPYHKEHVAAEMVERLVAFLAGVNWREYDLEVNSLEHRI